MTQDEAIWCDVGAAVEYRGQRVAITHAYRYQGVGRDAYRVSYHLQAEDGTNYHHIDSQQLTRVS